MFQRILVPLDGSLRAELALPVAVRLARMTGGSLLFLRVVTMPTDFIWYALEPPFRGQELVATETREASTYLAMKAWEMELAGIAVRTVITSGLPGQELLSCIDRENIDLVIMCHRGVSGSKRQSMGSVAQCVICQSSAPVLILQEGTKQSNQLHPQTPRPVRLLVPLDGSDRAEKVLPPAAFLATALAFPQCGSLHLVHVLTQTNAEKKLRPHMIDDMQAYLQSIRQRMSANGNTQASLFLTASVVAGPDVANTIRRVAEYGLAQPTEKVGAEDTYDAIALTRCGSCGLSGEPVSTIAQSLLMSAHHPLLVVPALQSE